MIASLFSSEMKTNIEKVRSKFNLFGFMIEVLRVGLIFTNDHRDSIL